MDISFVFLLLKKKMLAWAEWDHWRIKMDRTTNPPQADRKTNAHDRHFLGRIKIWSHIRSRWGLTGLWHDPTDDIGSAGFLSAICQPQPGPDITGSPEGHDEEDRGPAAERWLQLGNVPPTATNGPNGRAEDCKTIMNNVFGGGGDEEVQLLVAMERFSCFWRWSICSETSGCFQFVASCPPPKKSFPTCENTWHLSLTCERVLWKLFWVSGFYRKT